ncbi:MAG: multidrug effflux MFS transporter [Gammaproteobacteria bacterium]
MKLAKLRDIAVSVLLIILPISSSLCIDMYLPAYSSMATTFGVGEGEINLSMSIYLFGLAVGQLVYGSLADRFGRKIVLVLGLLLFSIASFACIVSVNLDMFLWSRLFQALGACSSIVLCRTIVTDSYHPEKRTTILALISAANIFSPAIAPLLGGVVTSLFSWRFIFVIIMIFGLIMFFGTVFLLRETLVVPDQEALKLFKIIANLKSLLANRIYIGYVFCLGALYSLVFVWVTFSPTILIDHFGVKSDYFGLYFLMPAIGSTLGAIFTAQFGHKFRKRTLIRFGLFAIFVAICGLSIIEYMHWDHSPFSVMVCVMLTFFATGMTGPLLTSSSLAQFVNIGGFASGMLGFVQIISGSSMGAITSLFYADSEHKLPVLMAGALGVSIIWFLFATFHRKTTAIALVKSRKMLMLFPGARKLNLRFSMLQRKRKSQVKKIE